MLRAVTRSGLNKGRYFGERIDSAAILTESRKLAAAFGFSEELAAAGDVELVFLKRTGRSGPNIYVSSGMHGDEPAGQLAMRELIRADRWPADANVWICPCLNPSGCALTTRENAAGIDLNRDYKHLRTAEVRTHIAWLEQQPRFDVTVCLHEDWESHGFYLYEVNPDGLFSSAETVIAAVREICPVDESAIIDGRESSVPGIIRPSIDPALRPEWPEAFWLLQNRCRISYTLEAPSDWPLEVRVNALIRATTAILGRFAANL